MSSLGQKQAAYWEYPYRDAHTVITWDIWLTDSKGLRLAGSQGRELKVGLLNPVSSYGGFTASHELQKLGDGIPAVRPWDVCSLVTTARLQPCTDSELEDLRHVWFWNIETKIIDICCLKTFSLEVICNVAIDNWYGCVGRLVSVLSVSSRIFLNLDLGTSSLVFTEYISVVYSDGMWCIYNYINTFNV